MYCSLLCMTNDSNMAGCAQHSQVFQALEVHSCLYFSNLKIVVGKIINMAGWLLDLLLSWIGKAWFFILGVVF